MDVWKVNQNSEECWHHFEEMGDTSRFLGFYVNQLWSWLFIWNWDVHFYDPNRNEQSDSRGHSTKKWDQVRQIQPSNVGYSSGSGNRSVETKELQRVTQLGWVGDSGGWNQFLLLSEFTNEDRSGVQKSWIFHHIYVRLPQGTFFYVPSFSFSWTWPFRCRIWNIAFWPWRQRTNGFRSLHLMRIGA